MRKQTDRTYLFETMPVRAAVRKQIIPAVAGLGITKKLDQIPLYFSVGISTGLLPLLAYNHAA